VVNFSTNSANSCQREYLINNATNYNQQIREFIDKKNVWKAFKIYEQSMVPTVFVFVLEMDFSSES